MILSTTSLVHGTSEYQLLKGYNRGDFGLHVLLTYRLSGDIWLATMR